MPLPGLIAAPDIDDDPFLLLEGDKGSSSSGGGAVTALAIFLQVVEQE